tara:strand:- start:284 stop:670 length:387 start_codon:yes stop_codon:yes gene_type:complete
MLEVINMSKYCWYKKELDRELDIDENLRVWPCCVIVNEFNERGNKLDDEYIDGLEPTWNDLNHHTMTEILNHPAFTDYWDDKTWYSENVSHICKNCTDRPLDSIGAGRANFTNVRNVISERPQDNVRK